MAAGSALTLPGTGRYAIYFIFPLTQEVNTLDVLRPRWSPPGRCW